jgi:hypothetical protein
MGKHFFATVVFCLPVLSVNIYNTTLYSFVTTLHTSQKSDLISLLFLQGL